MSKLGDRLGRCYELSAKYVLDNDGFNLVHGFITDKIGVTGHTIDHAWVEKEGNVYDPVLDMELPTEIHEAMFNAEVTIKYPRKSVLDMILMKEHWGPWHEVDKSKVVFNPDNSGLN